MFSEMFSEFYEKWMEQLEGHLALLLQVQTENSDSAICVATVNKLIEHHKEFYKVKWTHENVLDFWLTPFENAFENAFLWVTGWKPSMAFRLVESLKKGSSGSSLAAMTEEQTGKIEVLLAYIICEEEKVGMEMKRHIMAEKEKLGMMEMEGQQTRKEVPIGGLVGGMESVMKMADCVRMKTLKGVLEVLNPMQGVEILAATCTFQIKMRVLD